MQQLKARIEAVLLLPQKHCRLMKFQHTWMLNPEQIEEAILELIMDYASRDGALGN